MNVRISTKHERHTHELDDMVSFLTAFLDYFDKAYRIKQKTGDAGPTRVCQSPLARTSTVKNFGSLTQAKSQIEVEQHNSTLELFGKIRFYCPPAYYQVYPRPIHQQFSQYQYRC